MPGDRILVTGAGGFIGTAAIARLASAGCMVRGTYRRTTLQPRAGIEHARLDLDATDPIPGDLFRDITAVVHLAAHAHVRGVGSLLPGRFRRVNATGTRRLAEAAARSGVKRFVLVSTIGVTGGEQPAAGPGSRRYTEADRPNPRTPYARSKRAAEDLLVAACMGTKMEFVILRPPLVFGAGAPGSFQCLLQAVDRGLPLPLRGTDAWRSVIFIRNFADLILRSVVHPQAGGRILLVSDYDVQVPALIARLAALMDRPERMWRCPRVLLGAAACVPVLGAPLRLLTRSLLIDSSSVRRALDWSPPVGLDEALAETVRGYLAARG